MQDLLLIGTEMGLILIGDRKSAERWGGGEYYSYTYDGVFWEGMGVLQHPASGRSTHFIWSTIEFKDARLISMEDSVISSGNLSPDRHYSQLSLLNRTGLIDYLILKVLGTLAIVQSQTAPGQIPRIQIPRIELGYLQNNGIIADAGQQIGLNLKV